MKRMALIMSVVFLTAGCVSTKLPQYISDKNPYKREFYVPYEEAMAATQKALTEFGWEVSGEGSPSLYERAGAQEMEETILFTEVRQAPFFLGSRYYKLNAILRSGENKTEVEIRYLTITSLPFKNIESYRDDKAIEKIFDRIAKLLER